MEHDGLYGMLHSLWLVWLVVIFVVIAAWVFWPSRKNEIERHGKIPLRDDDED
jgi:cbb3-type cytochrome oxidase subunit 3